MALIPLKSIDNALPLPHEAIILGVNKENKTAASLPPADPIIDYISSGNLEPISDPESKIHGLVEELDSKDWTKGKSSVSGGESYEESKKCSVQDIYHGFI
ncbi:hypothetical protein OIU84_021873 [Salix udensis]|uniref:Uncharacterized protein n=1 Tax=Salix udensis TaxID=889485 RepID=A0AAD6KW05_9ROSI|nr:hypothetical protein OIU84_021873 [Salix udensis]